MCLVAMAFSGGMAAHAIRVQGASHLADHYLRTVLGNGQAKSAAICVIQ